METLSKTRRKMAIRRIRKARITKRAILIGRRVMMRLYGGPIESLLMHSAGTLPFSFRGRKGFYNQENKWVDL